MKIESNPTTDDTPFEQIVRIYLKIRLASHVRHTSWNLSLFNTFLGDKHLIWQPRDIRVDALSELIVVQQ